MGRRDGVWERWECGRVRVVVWVCEYLGQYGAGRAGGRRAAMEAEGNGWVSPAASGGDGRAKSQTWR